MFLASLCHADRKHLLSEMLQGASGFLEAIPSTELGLAWDPVEFTTEIRTRLMVDNYVEDSWRPCCQCVMDKKARHPAVCSRGGAR